MPKKKRKNPRKSAKKSASGTKSKQQSRKKQREDRNIAIGMSVVLALMIGGVYYLVQESFAGGERARIPIVVVLFIGFWFLATLWTYVEWLRKYF